MVRTVCVDHVITLCLLTAVIASQPRTTGADLPAARHTMTSKATLTTEFAEANNII